MESMKNKNKTFPIKREKPHRPPETSKHMPWVLLFFVLFSLISSLNLDVARAEKPARESFTDNEEIKPGVSLTAEESAWLDEHPGIRIGLPEGLVPYVMENHQGNQVGILVDFKDELNRALKTNFVLKTMPSSRIFEMSGNKDIDVIYAVEPRKAEQEDLMPTDVWAIGYPALYARKGSSIKTPDDMAGKTIVLRPNTVWDKEIVRPYASTAKIVYAETPLDAMRMVINEEADLYLGLTSHMHAVTRYRLFGISQAYVFQETQVPFVMGVRPDWPMLVSILNKGLAHIGREGLGKIVKKWIKADEREIGIKLSDEEQAWLAQNHTVRARVGNFPPYMIFNEEEITGIVIDYLNLIAQRSGVRFEFVSETRSWQEALKSLMNLRGPDLMTSLSPMAEREPYMDFSEPYMISPRMLFTRTDAEFISRIDDLSGRTLAVPYGTLVHKRIEKEYPDIGLLVYDTDLKSIEAVSTGRADAYIGNLINTSYEILLRGFTNLKVAAPTPFGDDLYTFGIRRDWPELSSIINKALNTITPAEKMAIRKRYLTIKYEHGISIKDVLKWGLGLGGGAFLIILLIVSWNRSLATKVRERTVDLDGINKSLEYEIGERKEKEQQLEEYQHRLKALASQLTLAEERERRSLAADLHDHVGHSLALARMQLNGILDAQSEVERNMLVKDISHILLKSLQDTRSLIFELSSPTLNEIGLGAAISEWLEERVEKKYGLKTEFVDEIDERLRKTLEDNVRAVLFRNVRELLTNVIKHAKAGNVSVHLKSEDRLMNVIVEDDGVGFDPQAAPPEGEEKRGYGLFSIRERMADMEGSFDIQSEPGKGCRAVLTVPVEKSEGAE